YVGDIIKVRVLLMMEPKVLARFWASI
ncbi:hypothetical protein HKBW3S09_00677, partial [Candidatus Hakubella thermalkaliphila]